MDSLLFYIFFWVVIWWRLWYVLFYNFSHFLDNPWQIINVWEWWMSFHWWIIWVVIAMWLFSKRHKVNFFAISDQIALAVPIWLWLWRLGNYLNWELLGFSWYDWFLSINWRFPSPLVELFLEGIVLFIILNLIYSKSKKIFVWKITSLFLILYWTFRIFVEAFFREPDAHIWYIWNYFTLWEIYSLPMVLLWIFLYIKLNKQKK